MKAARLFAMASGLLVATTVHAAAETGDTRPLSEERAEAIVEDFFSRQGDALVIRETDEVEAAWETLEENEREMLRVDCAATLEVGARVPSEGSATGDVAELPEVEAVDEDIRNEMESQENAPGAEVSDEVRTDTALEEGSAAGTDEPLNTTGPQRRALLADAVPADAWVRLCQSVVELD